MAGEKSPVLVAPAPHTCTKLKTPSSSTTRAIKCAPVNSKKKLVKSRQNRIFKRFTILVVEYIKNKFVWAKKKPVTPDIEHDKRIADKYVFDEVLGIYVPRDEFEKLLKFNSEQKPLREKRYDNGSDSSETIRFPSRPKQEQSDIDKNMDLTPSIPSDGIKRVQY